MPADREHQLVLRRGEPRRAGVVLAPAQKPPQARAQFEQPAVVVVARPDRHRAIMVAKPNIGVRYRVTIRKELTMAPLGSAYPGEAAARRAIDGLRAAGLPPQGAQLITGAALHDLRVEPVGEFAGRAAPDDPVRTFANTTVLRWRPGGSFAGDPDRQREGTFADVDGAVIVARDAGGHEHARVAGVRELETLFADA